MRVVSCMMRCWFDADGVAQTIALATLNRVWHPLTRFPDCNIEIYMGGSSDCGYSRDDLVILNAHAGLSVVFGLREGDEIILRRDPIFHQDKFTLLTLYLLLTANLGCCLDKSIHISKTTSPTAIPIRLAPHGFEQHLRARDRVGVQAETCPRPPPQLSQ